jgi:iron complex transport system ATP-binding protein
MSDVLQFSGVSVRRNGATLLDSVSWDIDEGERWVVLGPNGAGKTTLLQVASANLHPTRGQASILGETLGAVDVFELRPRIGLSSAALADRLPGKESVRNVVLTASYAVVGRWRERYDELDATRADELLDAQGERKRVQIARALMTDPELMLLDEPAAGLDLGGREDLLRRLAGIAADPYAPAMVLVTHHVEEIPPGFTHVLLLRGGRVVAAGPVGTTLTADNLGATFGIPLELQRVGERWTARATTGA